MPRALKVIVTCDRDGAEAPDRLTTITSTVDGRKKVVEIDLCEDCFNGLVAPLLEEGRRTATRGRPPREESATPIASDGRFSCDYDGCDRSYATEPRLLSHKEKVHSS